jgi:hypothetical protein
MYRVVVSHANAEVGEAKARKDWLGQQDPLPANDILLDADMDRPGRHWTDELNQAMKNTDAVVCATSNGWVGGPECIADFRTAEYLNNRVLCARPQSSPADEMGTAWQRADLFGNSEPAGTSLDDDGSLQNPSGTSGRLPQSKNTIKNKSTDMNDDDFWDDLLGRDQVPVPVVGPDLTVVKVGDAEQTLATFIGQRLAEKFHSAKGIATTTFTFLLLISIPVSSYPGVEAARRNRLRLLFPRVLIFKLT